MSGQDDRFGMPDSAFQAARDSHGANSPVMRLGMYVPTRQEVSQWPERQLYEVLIDWMWEGPSELIPDNQQISEVLEILESRVDSKS